MRRLVCKLIIPVVLAVSCPAQATETDSVSLANGSRMFGRVRELTRGELLFRVSGVGTIDIDWKSVTALSSAQRLDIELSSGERLLGAIAGARDGRLMVDTASGRRTVDMSEVVRITPIAATFRDRTTGAVDLGFEYLTSGDEIDWTLNAELANRTRHYLTELSLDSLVRRRDSETSQRRNRLDLTVRRFLPERWFVLGLFEAEEDRELDLDMRLLAGGALGRTLYQSNRAVFAVYGGADYDLEEFRGVPGTDHVVEILAALEFDWFELAGDTDFLTTTTTYYSPGEDRVRVNLDASLRRDIFTQYYWSLNLYESYNSNPPADLEKSDLGVSLTIGRTF